MGCLEGIIVHQTCAMLYEATFHSGSLAGGTADENQSITDR